MVTRRNLLVNGGAALVVVGGMSSWALSRTPKLATEPWKIAADELQERPLLNFLAYALLAPNPHNMQPWEIALVDETTFVLYPNLERLLPETDPPSRQITIGFGCFLELFRLAAASHGWRTDISPFPEGSDPTQLDGRPIAEVRVVKDRSIKASPLFDHVMSRRTNRLAFAENQSVSDATLVAIAESADRGLVGHTNDHPQLDEIKSIAVNAWKVEWEHPTTRRESINVTRIGKSEINQDPWGLSLRGPIIEGLKIIGAMDQQNMDIPGTSAYEESLKFYSKACESAAAFMWLVTPNNDRMSQLDAGRSWVRAHLKATELGVAFHPLSQALQEFPEMAHNYKRIHQLLAPNGGTVQMLVRLGYAQSPPAAPRERLDVKIIAL